jgi:molecular chaperone DnaK (HSP70)
MSFSTDTLVAAGMDISSTTIIHIMSSSTDTLVAVGMDIGSSYSRVAVATSESINQARIISNTLGHFETRSITTLEQHDSQNPQYIHGDAALRILENEKKLAQNSSLIRACGGSR